MQSISISAKADLTSCIQVVNIQHINNLIKIILLVFINTCSWMNYYYSSNVIFDKRNWEKKIVTNIHLAIN